VPCSSQQSLVAESSKSRAGVSLSYRRRRGDRGERQSKVVWKMCLVYVCDVSRVRLRGGKEAH